MGRIFCIMGKSCSGKDSVFRRLVKDKRLRLYPYVSYTTRPMRSGEKDGVEYHFIDEEALRRLQSEGKVIELRKYDTVKGAWYYCTVDDGSFDLHKNHIMIATLQAYNNLKKRFGRDAVFPVYIDVEDGMRLQRALNREKKQENPDYGEMCRRYLADCRDFSKENLKLSGIEKHYKNIHFTKCVGKIERDIANIIKKDAFK